MRFNRVFQIGAAAALLTLVACGDKNYAGGNDRDPNAGPGRERYDPDDTIFGEEGLTVSRLFSGELFSKGERLEGGSLPVNKYLWQASLDTLSFLPLASTDPFTGVIATDWGATPNQPGERFKVTAYLVSPALAASSLKVAVYREVRSPEGLWTPSAVDPDTARKIEDAILTRARQIKIAGIESDSTS